MKITRVVRFIFLFFVLHYIPGRVDAQTFFSVKGGIPHIPVFENTQEATTAMQGNPIVGSVVFSKATEDNTLMIFTGTVWQRILNSLDQLVLVQSPGKFFSVINGIPIFPQYNSPVFSTDIKHMFIYLDTNQKKIMVNKTTDWMSLSEFLSTTDWNLMELNSYTYFQAGKFTGFDDGGGVVFPVLTNVPTYNISEGAVYFNSVLKQLLIFINGSWMPITSLCGPIASGVAIWGIENWDISNSFPLNGGYAFFSQNAPYEEGPSIYRWHIADNANGLNSVVVKGSSKDTIMISNKYDHKFIRFEVIPASSGNPVRYGDHYFSDWYHISLPCGPIVTGINFIVDQASKSLDVGYTYYDSNEDHEGSTTFIWYVADSKLGNNMSIFSGPSTSSKITIPENQLNKSYSVTINPRALTGNTEGYPVPSEWITYNECEPQVDGVHIITNRDNATVTAGYSYYDANEDVEGQTMFSWEVSTNADGSNPSLIAGATSDTYSVQPADYNNYLRVTITPKAQTGKLVGSPVSSAWFYYRECEPQVAGINISNNRTQETLIAEYSYFDYEEDPEGTSTYQWEVSTNADGSNPSLIAGATSDTYSVQPADYNNYLRVTITPKAQTGKLVGSPVSSAWFYYRECEPQIAGVNVELDRISETLSLRGYAYYDKEGDDELATSDTYPSYKWEKSTDATNATDGTYSSITGATDATLNNLPWGSWVKVTLTPKAQKGNSIGTATSSVPIHLSQCNPQAVAVNIAINTDTQTLTAGYAYYDADGDEEDASLFVWEVSADKEGPYSILDDFTANIYSIQEESGLNKWYRVSVIPKAKTGAKSGVLTLPSDPVYFAQCEPQVAGINISNNRTQETLIAEYSYFDYEEDPEGTSTYQWEVSTNADGSDPSVIVGATSDTYNVQPVDYNKYFRISITPQALTGKLIGSPVSSAWFYYRECEPQATGILASYSPSSNDLNIGYAYYDYEDDPEGIASFRWEMSDFNDGANPSTISGATESILSVQQESIGKYYKVTITPIATRGILEGSTVSSGWITNNAPEATDLMITLDVDWLKRQIKYNYFDSELNPEGNSIYQWEVADNANGVGSSIISGANTKTINISYGDAEKYYRCTVTPIALYGQLTGLPVISDWKQILNAAPVASNVDFTYNSVSCSASYTYSDAESDPKGTPIYNWEIADNASGMNTTTVGTNGTDFNIAESQFNKWVRVTITPRALYGQLTGLPVISGWKQIINAAPVASNVDFTYNSVSCSASYTYSDAESDPKGTPIYNWEIADNASGMNATTVGTNGPDFNIAEFQFNKWVRVTVNPRALYGQLKGLPVISGWKQIQNTVPVARSLAITYYRTSGSSYNCSASIDYFDADNDPQETPFYYWEIADDGSGNNAKNIGFAGSDFIIAETQFNKWVRFTVTPRAKTGLLAGTPKTSSWTQLINNAPRSSSSVYLFINLGSLRLNYSYFDADSDPSDTQIYKWETADDESGTNVETLPNISGSNYFDNYSGKWVRVTITPKATAGVLTGTPVTTPWFHSVNTKPICTNVNITSDGNYCSSTYTYYDSEQDEEDTPLYTWVISDEANYNYAQVIIGENNSTLDIQPYMYDKFIRLVVKPKAKTGEAYGDFSDSNFLFIKRPSTTVADAIYSSELSGGKILNKGEFIISDNKVYKLIMQYDGNLCLDDIFGNNLWSSGTDGSGGVKAIMQNDGNLVIYKSNGDAVWDSGTDGNSYSRIVMQDDGNLVIYKSNGEAIWSSGTDTDTEYATTWMQDNLDILGNKKLNEICILGSHDAAMYEATYRNEGTPDCAVINQSVSILEQLCFGVRYFDIRPTYIETNIYGSRVYTSGHYSFTPFEVIVGASGCSIAKIVNDINTFTENTNELIILNLSHFLNRNTQSKFDQSYPTWGGLFDLLKGINNLYIYPNHAGLDHLIINQKLVSYIGNGKSAVVIIVDPIESDDFLWVDYYNGVYPYKSMPYFGEYSNTNSYNTMKTRQEESLRLSINYPMETMVLLHWYMTQSTSDATSCGLNGTIFTGWQDIANSVLDYADIANSHLYEILPIVKRTVKPNILLLDNIKDISAIRVVLDINNLP
ncbi:MAG: hypothetical protein K0M50_19305 [Prolixibacteraceae bacterium]|nr:hypothetical protein [Prolixibacteraceae bacterium]